VLKEIEMFFFLSLNFWFGVALGAALSPLWVKIGSYLWGLFAQKDPTAAADVAAAGSVVSAVATPVVTAVENSVPTPPASK